MNAILGFAEILLNTTTDNIAKNYINNILSSGKTLLGLINDLLDLSKIESGNIILNYEPLDFTVIFNELQMMFFEKAASKKIDFIFEIDDNIIKGIELDEIRIRQILINLINNAIKFTEKGYVKIKAKTEKTGEKGDKVNLIIEIEDSGIGIDEDELTQIFESFRQSKRLSSKHYGGTGLGLAITKKLTELMNGTISVKSKLNEGSKFTVIFNNLNVSDRNINYSNKEYEWSKNNIEFDNVNLLVIDDIEKNIEIVKGYLNRFNINVYGALSGKEGINKAREINPHLILLDIRMPELDGYEVLSILKQDPKTKHIPVIAFTASAMTKEIDGLKEKFDGFLMKPIQHEILMNYLIKFTPNKFSENISEVKKEKHTDKDYFNFKKKDFEVNKQKLILFDHKFSQKFLELKDYLMLDDLKDLIKSVKEFNEQYHFEVFNHFITKLEEYYLSFDIENVQYMLSEYNNFIIFLKHEFDF
jgi:two-component system sensor histidine kinase EvgS